MSSYGALLARPTARALACVCATGWLAFAAVTLTLVLLVRDARGGDAFAAGAVVAAYALAAGALAPLRGRALDRGGRAALLVAFAAAHAALLLALAGAAAGGAPTGMLVVLAGLAGASTPPLIATARTLWPRVAGPELTRAGYALTALLGDAAGVLGPPAAAVLAAGAGPAAALAAVAFAPLAAALLLRRLLASTVTSDPHKGADVTEVRLRRGLAALVAADALAGLCLGAVEVTLPARAGASAAVPLAAFAAASMGAAWWSGRARGAAGRPRRRLAAGLPLLTAGSTLALACGAVHTGSTPLLVSSATAVAGAGYGLLTVALLELLDRVAPPGRQVEAFTWLTSAQALGLALGSLSAGALA